MLFIKICRLSNISESINKTGFDEVRLVNGGSFSDLFFAGLRKTA